MPDDMLESGPSRRRDRGRLFMAGASLALLAAFGLAWWMAARADRRMRADVLVQAGVVAQGIDVERVKSLSDTAADPDTPCYSRLKSQLATIRSAYPRCRRICVIGRRIDDTILTLVDSGAVASKRDVSEEEFNVGKTDGSRRVFAAGLEILENPSSGRSSNWLRAFVPIRDRERVVAVLCMDIDAREWTRRLVAAATPPVLLAMALVAVSWISVMVAARRARMPDKRRRSARRLEPILTAVVGVMVTFFAAWLANGRETQRRNDAFRQLAMSRTEAVADELRDIREIGLEGLASFYENSVTVTLEEYQRFAAYLAKDRTVQAWEWIPAVPDEEKTRFEEDARAEGLKDFEIWQRDAQGRRTPAVGRTVYYPVFQVAPLSDSEATRGFDLGSEPVRRAAIEEAARENLPNATEPIVVTEDSNDRKGMLVLRPVIVQGEPNRLRGFAVAVLRMDAMLPDATSDDATHVELTLWREGAEPELLATTCTGGIRIHAELTATRPVCAFGKVFAVTAHAGPSFSDLYPAQAGGLAIVVGLALTAAVVVITVLVLRRREQLERLVAVRTAALRESKQRFDQLTELTRRVEQRTAELAAANTALNEFAYVVSHDLKAPLRAVGQLAHWISEDYAAALDDAGRQKLDLMRGRISRMYNLIDGILQYSRIGRVDEDRRPLDLDALVREVIESLSPPAHIRVTVESRLPVITADRVRMEQLFQNLISNAIKYMDKAEGVVSIGYEDLDRFRQFWVKDNGPGIDPKYHQKVFGIFQTLASRDRQESTGIGLSLVKKIVETYGGKVELQSQVGQGCAFFFTLPR